MITNDIIEDSHKYIMNTYGRQPLVLVKGRGTKVYDSDGREYLDFVSGVAVNNLGHCHPRVVVALQKQAQRLMHVSNHFHIEPQINLAKALVAHSFGDKAFFCNSGAEAVEAAIKLARRYAREVLKQDRYEIITMRGSFHGRTYGAVSATAQEKFHKGFEPMVPGFRYVPFNDIEAVEEAVNEHTCAVLVEPVQGEGGVNVPSHGIPESAPGALRQAQHPAHARRDPDRHGENGETLRLRTFGNRPRCHDARQGARGGHADRRAACHGQGRPGVHPRHPRLDLRRQPAGLRRGDRLARDPARGQHHHPHAVARLGEYFLEGLGTLKGKYSFVREVRGQGLLVGMELDFPGKDIVAACIREGMLINCTMDTVLRFMPPLIITEEEIDLLIEALDRIFAKR